MQVNKRQLQGLHRAYLVRWRNDIARQLAAEFGRLCPSDPDALQPFVSRCIDAARAVHVDEPSQWLRMARVSWAIESCKDPSLSQALTITLMQEEPAAARLAFLEQHLLPRAMASLRSGAVG